MKSNKSYLTHSWFFVLNDSSVHLIPKKKKRFGLGFIKTTIMGSIFQWKQERIKLIL